MLGSKFKVGDKVLYEGVQFEVSHIVTFYSPLYRYYINRSLFANGHVFNHTLYDVSENQLKKIEAYKEVLKRLL